MCLCFLMLLQMVSNFVTDKSGLLGVRRPRGSARTRFFQERALVALLFSHREEICEFVHCC